MKYHNQIVQPIRVKLFNVVNLTVQVKFNDHIVENNLKYKDSSNYIPMSSGKLNIKVISAKDEELLVNETIQLDRCKFIIITQEGEHINLVVVEDFLPNFDFNYNLDSPDLVHLPHNRDSIVKQVVTKTGEIVEVTTDKIGLVLEDAKDSMGNVVVSAGTTMKRVIDQTGQVMEVLVDQSGTIIAAVVEGAMDSITFIGEAIGKVITTVVDEFGNVVEVVINEVQDIVGWVINEFGELVGSIKKGLTKKDKLVTVENEDRNIQKLNVSEQIKILEIKLTNGTTITLKTE